MLYHLLWILFGWNLTVFFIYGLDKLFSKQNARRISEAFLLTAALCMGAVGAMFGMVIWNHKTKKMKFRILVPLLVLFNVGFSVGGIVFFLW